MFGKLKKLADTAQQTARTGIEVVSDAKARAELQSKVTDTIKDRLHLSQGQGSSSSSTAPEGSTGTAPAEPNNESSLASLLVQNKCEVTGEGPAVLPKYARIILDRPLFSLDDAQISLEEVGTPCAFRFLDCKAFINENLLRIIEVDDDDARNPKYAALSYVWRGNPIWSDDYSEPDIFFRVKGAEDADDISLNVMRTVCFSALKFGCEFLWMDRLCIMQTNKRDKNWQIQQMKNVYKDCDLSLVLPGGLLRLVTLFEETTWIKRAWTLQETLAPPRCVCLFRWTLGPAIQWMSTSGMIEFEVMEPNLSAAADVAKIVPASISMSSGLRLRLDSPIDKLEPYQTGERETGTAGIVVDNDPGDDQPEGKIIYIRLLQVKILGVDRIRLVTLASAFIGETEDSRQTAIWRSLWTRTSSRPVDMVLSAMGLFGVTLNASQFGPNDRVAATKALAKAILENGGSANWLGIAMSLPPSDKISYMPTIPVTDVEGNVNITISNQTMDIAQWLEKKSGGIDSIMDWYLKDSPKGTIDNDGDWKLRGQFKWLKSLPEGDVLGDEHLKEPADSAYVLAFSVGDLDRYGDAMFGLRHIRESAFIMILVKTDQWTCKRVKMMSTKPENLSGWGTGEFTIR